MSTRQLLDDEQGTGASASALKQVTVQRLRLRQLDPLACTDQVAVEAAVALSFNGLSHAVMMATPTALDALGLGFALSEGIIDTLDQCLDLSVLERAQGTEVAMQISTRAFEALKGRRRSMEGRSGCGLCGIDSLEALGRWPAPARPPTPHAVDIAVLVDAFAQLPDRQPLNQRTGGCHAAGWATPDGRLQWVFEDVGRHNALDKLIGHLAARQLLHSPGAVILSSRASFELVRKCAQVGIGTMATISAPSSLAIEVAQASSVALLGFCRHEGAVRYA
ncbi:MAG: formate dehydrogenase accessory sulfurtransferase FdhD [Rubrivivax sp.]|nr:MAG: formate dehydrogenase accessory sulfurtransferase FdhD [Rubrivivax sp.]